MEEQWVGRWEQRGGVGQRLEGQDGGETVAWMSNNLNTHARTHTQETDYILAHSLRGQFHGRKVWFQEHKAAHLVSAVKK